MKYFAAYPRDKQHEAAVFCSNVHLLGHKRTRDETAADFVLVFAGDYDFDPTGFIVRACAAGRPVYVIRQQEDEAKVLRAVA